MKTPNSKPNSIALGYAKSIVTKIVVKSLSVEPAGQNVLKMHNSGRMSILMPYVMKYSNLILRSILLIFPNIVPRCLINAQMRI